MEFLIYGFAPLFKGNSLLPFRPQQTSLALEKVRGEACRKEKFELARKGKLSYNGLGKSTIKTFKK